MSLCLFDSGFSLKKSKRNFSAESSYLLFKLLFKYVRLTFPILFVFIFKIISNTRKLSVQFQSDLLHIVLIASYFWEFKISLAHAPHSALLKFMKIWIIVIVIP